MSRGGKRQGAGRKSGPERVAVTVRIVKPAARVLESYCRKRRRSQARAVEEWAQLSVAMQEIARLVALAKTDMEDGGICVLDMADEIARVVHSILPNAGGMPDGGNAAK